MNVKRKEKDTGSKVIVENGEIKTIFSEEVKNNNGQLSLEEISRLLTEGVNKIIELYGKDARNDK